MFKILSTAVFLIASMLSVVNCDAGVFTYTYTGHVESGSDKFGYFGVGNDLTGQVYSATYTYTVPTPGAAFTDDGFSQYLSGGSQDANTSPISATFTINGITLIIDRNQGRYGQVSRDTRGGDSWILDTESLFDDAAYVYDTYVEHDLSGLPQQIFSSYDLTTPLNSFNLGAPGIHTYGQFYFTQSDKATDSYVQDAGGFLTIETVTQEGVSTVPEPASMLVFGGLAGLAAIRFRRKKATL